MQEFALVRAGSAMEHHGGASVAPRGPDAVGTSTGRTGPRTRTPTTETIPTPATDAGQHERGDQLDDPVAVIAVVELVPLLVLTASVVLVDVLEVLVDIVSVVVGVAFVVVGVGVPGAVLTALVEPSLALTDVPPLSSPQPTITMAHNSPHARARFTAWTLTIFASPCFPHPPSHRPRRAANIPAKSAVGPPRAPRPGRPGSNPTRLCRGSRGRAAPILRARSPL